MTLLSEHDRFIFTLFLDVTRKTFQKLWIFLFVDRSQYCRGCPSAWIHHGAIRQITCNIITGWRFAIFWFGYVSLTK